MLKKFVLSNIYQIVYSYYYTILHGVNQFVIIIISVLSNALLLFHPLILRLSLIA